MIYCLLAKMLFEQGYSLWLPFPTVIDQKSSNAFSRSKPLATHTLEPMPELKVPTTWRVTQLYQWIRPLQIMQRVGVFSGLHKIEKRHTSKTYLRAWRQLLGFKSCDSK